MKSLQYAKHGTCRFENFPECLNNPTEQALGESGGVNWYMKLSKVDDEGNFRPSIYYKCFTNREDVRIAFRIYMSIPNRTGKSYCCSGKHIIRPTSAVYSERNLKLQDVLDELEKWVRNGMMFVEYGIHVESMKMEDGIWKFNFKDKLFNPEKKSDGLTIKCQHQSQPDFHFTKQLLKFHSPVLSQYVSNPMLSIDTIRFGEIHDTYMCLAFEKCFQIAHGVRLNLKVSNKCVFVDWQIGDVIRMAEKFELQNVIRYCDQKLIESNMWPASTDVTCKNRKRFMAHSLKRMDSSRQFKEICHYGLVGSLKPEIVRMILDKFMENDF